jgi:hypothetical protein
LEAIDHEDAVFNRPHVFLRDIVGAAGGQDEHDGLSRVEHPEIPAVADLALHGGEDQPARRVAMPPALLLTALDQGVIQRLEQGHELLPAAGAGPLGQVEAMTAEVGPQPVGGAVEQVRAEQDGDPDGDAEGTLGDQSWRRLRRDDAGMNAAGAGRSLAAAANTAAVGLDVALEDRGVVGAGEGGEGLATALTAALVVGQVAPFLGRGPVGVIAAAMALGAALLAAPAAGRFGHRGGRVVRRRPGAVSGRAVGREDVGGVVGFGLASEEAMAEVADLGLEVGHRLLELVFALAGALMPGLVVGSLPLGIAERLLEGAGFARERRKRGRRGSGGQGMVIHPRGNATDDHLHRMTHQRRR